MDRGFRKEHINPRGLSWRITFKVWTNRGCDLCELLNEENPVENRLFYTRSRREFKEHLKWHKEQK